MAMAKKRKGINISDKAKRAEEKHKERLRSKVKRRVKKDTEKQGNDKPSTPPRNR